MSFRLPMDNINLEPFMEKPSDFNRSGRLMRTFKCFECEITNIVDLTEIEKLYQLRFINPREAALFSFLPGQFVMVEVPGFGEIPVSISSSSSAGERIELCIRRVGKVTGILHRARTGARLGIRGPFGTHFPMGRMAGRDLLFVAGGLGLAPLRAPIFWVNEHRSQYGKVNILYGTRDPEQILFDYQFREWSQIFNYNVRVIVEHPDTEWSGSVGRITDLFAEIDIEPAETFAIVCGPPVMFKFVCAHLSEIGIPMDRMFVDLERRMHCGMGKCCRCMVGSTFTCVDGPVMDYWTVMNLKEAI